MMKLLLTVMATFAMVTNGQRAKGFGNKISPSDKGFDDQPGTLLLNDIVLSDGVVFAFQAWYRNTLPMYFQVWRPQCAGCKNHRLIGEVRVEPTTGDKSQLLQNQVEDVYINLIPGATCFRVKQGDRLGIFNSIVPGSATYEFFDSTTEKMPDTLSYLGTGDNPVVGEVRLFDQMKLPFRYGVAVYVDTDVSKYPATGDVECPKSLIIPKDVPPTPKPVTGAPGVIGETGPQGANGSIGAEGPVGSTGPTGGQGQTGPEGEVGATGAAGAAGATGVTGVSGATGATGPKGGTGATGDQGEEGEEGDAGTSGPRGPKGNPGKGETQYFKTGALTESIWLKNPNLKLGMLVWLIVLTIVFIIIVIVYCVRRKRQADKGPKYNNRDSAYSNAAMMAEMREKHSSFLLDSPPASPVTEEPTYSTVADDITEPSSTEAKTDFAY